MMLVVLRVADVIAGLVFGFIVRIVLSGLGLCFYFGVWVWTDVI